MFFCYFIYDYTIEILRIKAMTRLAENILLEANELGCIRLGVSDYQLMDFKSNPRRVFKLKSDH